MKIVLVTLMKVVFVKNCLLSVVVVAKVERKVLLYGGGSRPFQVRQGEG